MLHKFLKCKNEHWAQHLRLIFNRETSFRFLYVDKLHSLIPYHQVKILSSITGF